MSARGPIKPGLAVAALALFTWTADGAGKTFDLQMRFFCHSAPADGLEICGMPGITDKVKLEGWVRENVQALNLYFRPNGVAFRPLPPITQFDETYSRIDELKQPRPPQNEALLEDLRNIAKANAGVLTLFQIEDLSTNWSPIPLLPAQAHSETAYYGVFCSPLLGNSSLWAHEIGHHFGLFHTFVEGPIGGNMDPVELPLGQVFSRDGDGLDCTADDPSPYEDFGDAGKPSDPKHQYDDFDGGGSPTGNLKVGFEYCAYVDRADYLLLPDPPASAPPPVDAGSPLPSYCIAQCRQSLGQGEESLSIEPTVFNVMTYYFCPGPFVLGGVRRNSFCSGQKDQVQTILAQVPERQNLVDVCLAAGGDFDLDGVCGNHDNCPIRANTLQEDVDKDGFGDKCDLCANDPDDMDDLDDDGIGDACDPDRDNDGCENSIDQHPNDGMVKVGTHTDNCDPAQTKDTFGNEGLDPDHDGLLSCKDPDDDNDGVPDATDGCPTMAGNGCHTTSLLCQAWITKCSFGACDHLELHAVSLGPGDPVDQFKFGKVSPVGDTIFVEPIDQQTISETGMAMLPGRGATIALQLWDKISQNVVATVVEYSSGQVALGNLAQGSLLRITTTRARGETIAVDGVYAVGTAPGDELADQDEDTVPDASDNCLLVGNLDQRDADVDHIGDLCDADLDNDAMVTATDVQAVAACIGVDYRMQLGVHELGFHSATAPGQATNVALGPLCQEADLNGDRVVDALDQNIAQASVGEPPGPSGQITPQPPSIAAWALDPTGLGLLAALALVLGVRANQRRRQTESLVGTG